ncbi:MAG TPA: hypothetical protein VK960_05170 [Acidimicrobiia bacterium]|nr:hypothetical protein [Acidimicrobiia bacterium]
MKRWVGLLLVLLPIAGCGTADPGDPEPSEPSVAELAAFCMTYTENSHLANLELMEKLVDVAPPGYADILERESMRGGSIEDTEAVHALFDLCDSMDGDP